MPLTCEVTGVDRDGRHAGDAQVIQQLAEIGVHLSIDDFGTSYSNLSCLRKLPAEELKRSTCGFVLDLEGERRRARDRRCGRQARAGDRAEGRCRGRRDRAAAAHPAPAGCDELQATCSPPMSAARARALGDEPGRPARARFSAPRCSARRGPSNWPGATCCSRSPRLIANGAMKPPARHPRHRAAGAARAAHRRARRRDGHADPAPPARRDRPRGALRRPCAHDLKGNHDLLSLTRPDVVLDIHRDYLRAGADIVSTNTFGATAIAQQDYGLAGVVRELNAAGAAGAPGMRRVLDARQTQLRRRRARPHAAANISPDVNDPAARNVTSTNCATRHHEQAVGPARRRLRPVPRRDRVRHAQRQAAIFALDELMEEKLASAAVIVSGTVTDASGAS